MWDERYNSEEFAYGTQPNDFLKDNYHHIPKGSVLSIAEGEGRNAVFLAKMGYKVTAVDSSLVGIDKARKLAAQNNVDVEFIHADLKDFDIGKSQWDGIVSIFCALPSSTRASLYKKVAPSLKQDGVFFLESYTPEQIQYGTGGGSSIDTMQSVNTLKKELSNLNFIHLEELEREVIEGVYHTGLAAVVQVIAVNNS